MKSGNEEERAVMTEMERGISSVLATVAGTAYRSDEGDAVVILRDDPYVVSVDDKGNTSSAYLVTVHPAEIAKAMDLFTEDVGGWVTGWDA